jgi:hypothetical protein
VAYLASLADSGLKASTIRRHCAAIAYAHRLKGLEPPTLAAAVKAVLRRVAPNFHRFLRPRKPTALRDHLAQSARASRKRASVGPGSLRLMSSEFEPESKSWSGVYFGHSIQSSCHGTLLAASVPLRSIMVISGKRKLR